MKSILTTTVHKYETRFWLCLNYYYIKFYVIWVRSPLCRTFDITTLLTKYDNNTHKQNRYQNKLIPNVTEQTTKEMEKCAGKRMKQTNQTIAT